MITAKPQISGASDPSHAFLELYKRKEAVPETLDIVAKALPNMCDASGTAVFVKKERIEKK